MTKDTVNIHGKEYETVASRVKRFRDLNKDEYSILTELISSDEKTVVMKAVISKGDRIIATGYAEENRTSSSINRTSAMENAETSAIGRCLANYGMAGTEYASADEVAQAIHQQAESKTFYAEIKPTHANKSGSATQKQREFVADLMNQNKIPVDDQLGYLVETLGVEVPLTFEGAQFAIEELKRTVRQTVAA